MKKTVKIHLSILLTLILLFLPVGNISVIQAASNKSLNEVKNYISLQDNSTISVSDSKGNKFSILYDKKKDTLSFSSDITNDGVSITVNLTAKSNLKGKSDISVTFNTDYSNIKGSAKKKISKIGLSSTKFKMQIEGVNDEDSDIQSLMNDMLDFSLSVWQKLLIYKTDYRLKDIGFKKLKKLNISKGKTVHHEEVGHLEWQEVSHPDGFGGSWEEDVQVWVVDAPAYDETKFSDKTRIIHHDEVGHWDRKWVTEDDDFGGYQEYATQVWEVDSPTYDEIIFSAKVWDKVFSADTPGVKLIHHDGHYWCNTCGADFTTWEDANVHCDSDIACYMNGWSGTPGWDEIVKVQQ